MSVINRMLQDLDRRQALGAGLEGSIVRPPSKPRGREWFWRTLAVLMAVSVGWVVWVALQLIPRPLVTELAYRAAAEAQSRPEQIVQGSLAQPVAQPAAEAIAQPEPVEKPAEEPAAPPAGDALKLAMQLETPVREKPQREAAGKPLALPRDAPPPAKPASPQAVPLSHPVAASPQAELKASVDKRDRSRSGTEVADGHFRRAVVLLNQGRVSEAEEQLVAALHVEPRHPAARQAYVSLMLEQQRVDAAKRLLQEALTFNPAQATFALALARIHAEQREYGAALEVMERAGTVAKNADFQALRGIVLQRLGRHGEAAEALQAATAGGPQPGASWVALGISLEALGRKPEAAQAYRRALGTGPLAAEARDYAERRARALE